LNKKNSKLEDGRDKDIQPILSLPFLGEVGFAWDPVRILRERPSLPTSTAYEERGMS
jgi:hypothetical protein